MVDYSDLIARLRAADCWDAHYYDKGFGTARNVSAPHEAATALEALSARERVLREALVTAVIPLEAMNLAGMVHSSPELQQGVLEGIAAVRTALTNQDGGEKL